MLDLVIVFTMGFVLVCFAFFVYAFIQSVGLPDIFSE